MPGAFISAIPIALIVYYALVWAVRGRDPRAGTPVVRYAAPQGITPAAARFARQGSSDGKMLAAVLVSMAAKGAITITPHGDEWVVASVAPSKDAPASSDSLRRTSAQYPQLAPEEKRVFDLMFQWGDPASFQGFEQKRASVLVNDIEASLREQYEKQLYVRNGAWLAGGIFGSFAILITLAAFMPSDTAMFMTLWLFWFTFGLMAIAVLRLGQAFKDIARHRVSGRMAANTLIFTPLLFSVPLFVAWKMSAETSRDFVVALLASVTVNAFAIPLLNRRSAACQQLVDELNGYAQFLASVDAAQLQQINAAGKPAELMNEALAYAIALDVREAWGDHFAGAFAAATVAIG